MDYDEMVEKAKKNSIGSEKKEKLKLKIKKVASTAVIVMVALATAVCTTGCAKYDRQTALYYNLVYKEEAEAIMHSYGLNTLEHYDYEVYKNMPEISEENISGFYQLLGKTESEKAVRALGYDGWDDYLIKHGHIKDGKPSFLKWEESWVTARESQTETKGENENGNESSRTK